MQGFPHAGPQTPQPVRTENHASTALTPGVSAIPSFRPFSPSLFVPSKARQQQSGQRSVPFSLPALAPLSGQACAGNIARRAPSLLFLSRTPRAWSWSWTHRIDLHLAGVSWLGLGLGLSWLGSKDVESRLLHAAMPAMSPRRLSRLFQRCFLIQPCWPHIPINIPHWLLEPSLDPLSRSLPISSLFPLFRFVTLLSLYWSLRVPQSSGLQDVTVPPPRNIRN